MPADSKSLIEKIEALPAERIAEIEDFVDFIRLREQERALTRAAGLADQILKGANPADLPLELPTRFDLAVNLKTANALALTIPESILVRADDVIE